ncbi:myb-like DNA-binding/DnaJ domain containing protein [Babesia divergens]|uniref:DnaJ homolog subfamily C member 2 n=1 Tax=Babesia divergens TaxID=32595 RepID=A0AAD9GID4_BABDI|nr:myb-like DNA-binding/DnaJ domain containing protein [Babesia divergens]
MIAQRPLALPRAAFNDEQPIVFKAYKAVRRIENAGFAFFLTKEWKLNVKYQDIFEPTQVPSVAKEAQDAAEAFLHSWYMEGSNALYTFELKREWAQLLAAVEQTSAPSDRSDGESEGYSMSSKGSTKKCLGLVRDFVSKKQDAYELLNVGDSDDITKIKANYKKIVLLLHPDKAANTKVPEDFEQYANKYRLRNLCEEERKQQFILLQDAFTILSDPDLRHEYDCSLPFDESIPSREDAKLADDFFALFIPVFDLNARWSRIKPVPSLGTASSSDEEVDAFYDFWREFETTRTFSHAAPHLLDDAESREEKRWMERENQKVQRKLVKKELVRIQKLVDLAQSFDPRIKSRAERKRLEKLERQRQIEEQRLREEYVHGGSTGLLCSFRQERKEEEERQRFELERSQSRERFEKQIVKKLRQHLRGISSKLLNGAQLSQNFDRLSELDYTFVKESCQDIYSLLGHSTVLEGSEESLQFVKRMDSIVKSAVIEGAEPFERIIQRVSSRISPSTEEKVTETPVTKQETPREETSAEWTAEELSRLSKAVEVYVAGVSNRWSLIAKQVKTKTAAQCIQAARDIASGLTVASAGTGTNGVNGDMWSTEQQSELEKALAKYPPSLDPATRWRMIASEVQGKTPKECLARFKMVRSDDSKIYNQTQIKATIAATARK